MFKKFVEKYNLPSFRLKQLQEQYFIHNISSWDELTTWSKDMRETLKKEVPFSKLGNMQEFSSGDGRTVKLLSYTYDGYPVESVLMRNKDRITICISSMSGCPVGCKFCATGRMKNNRILDEQEIIDQVMYFKRKLAKENESVTNIVFMGMGEPLLNLENVLNAIKILTDPELIGLSRRRITLSTVGFIEPLKEFFKANTGVKIAISLHAPNQRLREFLMPKVAKDNRLDDLMRVLIDYQKKKGKKVTYEYILIKDVNDSVEHAKELAKLLKNQICLVNLINFNKSDNIPFEATTKRRVEDFQTILNSRGINNTLRHSHGNDILAACGQLASIS